MQKGILGRKIAMTEIFDDKGRKIPVTVVDVEDNVILQQKNEAKDGYVATQVGFMSKRENLVSKPELGKFTKAKTAPKRFVKEIRFNKGDSALAGLEVGKTINAEIFEAGDIVDVTGTSKGKGFQGAVKRHGFATGFSSHGSRYHRGPGSMGAVKGNLKGKKLPGHMGNKKVTVQNLKVVKVDKERQVLLISGSVPGPNKGLVMIRSAVKKQN